jgi:hypothetical protein
MSAAGSKLLAAMTPGIGTQAVAGWSKPHQVTEAHAANYAGNAAGGEALYQMRKNSRRRARQVQIR